MHLVNWGEETVAFNEATACTHAFDQDTARLVAALRVIDGTVTSAVLWEMVFGDTPSESECQALNESLEKLVMAGLVTAPTT